jgi:hypothetical protein
MLILLYHTILSSNVSGGKEFSLSPAFIVLMTIHPCESGLRGVPAYTYAV